MDNYKSLNELFGYVKTILELKKKVSPKSNNFTVFSALRNETDEEKTHTTFLYEILRPDGLHGMKDDFLKDFFKTVLKIKKSPQNVNVIQECFINSYDDIYGRPDICIETDSARYPIEIKIYADDQDKQIERYYNFAKKKSEISQVYYLTLNGRPPSEKSLGDLEEDKIICISFAEDILAWLNNCADMANREHAYDVATVINQYRTLINKLTDGQQDDAYMDAINKLVNSNKDNYECAAAFAEAVKNARTGKLRDLFTDIGKILNKICDSQKYDISINDPEELEELQRKISDYYSKKTIPTIWFEIKKVKNTDIRIIFQIEVDDVLRYGVLYTNGGWDQIPEQKDLLLNAFGRNNQNWNNCINKRGSWWVWKIDVEFKGMKLNFKDCNGFYSDLFDESEYNSLLDTISEDLADNIENIIKKGTPLKF